MGLKLGNRCAIFLSAVSLFCAVPSCRAQAVAAAQLSGQVTDPSGSGVPAASVQATQTNTANQRYCNR